MVPQPEGKMLKIKRAYVPAKPADGYRVLVDRLWPRGVSKTSARIDVWLKDVAPSDALRKWFGHDPARWTEFAKRYRRELQANPEPLRQLQRLIAEHGSVTLVYSAHDEQHNQAVVLQEILRRRR